MLQLLELQLEQDELPAVGVTEPPLSFMTEAQRDITRPAVFWQWGQQADSLAWLNRRNSSNLALQSGQ